MNQLSFADRLRIYAKTSAPGTTVRVAMTTDELETMATFCDLADEHRRLVDDMAKEAKRQAKWNRIERWLLVVWGISMATWITASLADWLK